MERCVWKQKIMYIKRDKLVYISEKIYIAIR